LFRADICRNKKKSSTNQILEYVILILLLHEMIK
jgi:hypothetical protein